MHSAPRHLVHRRAIGLQAARRAVFQRLVRQEAVPRHEYVLDHHGVAAGPPQPDNVPDVVDSVLAARDEEAAEIDGPAVLDQRTAEERPRDVVTTGGPVPRAADEAAA